MFMTIDDSRQNATKKSQGILMVDLLVLTSFDQLIYKLKSLFAFFTK
jgi:hypothetical protein